MFIGREKEIKKINEFLDAKGSLLVYGLRRVGKTVLIKKALDDSKKKYVYFECIKADEETNVKLFTEQLHEEIGFIDATFQTFLAVFKELNKSYKDFVFVIDEYSYLKQYYSESKQSNSKIKLAQIDSEFQNIIDNNLTNINLIISGSSINIMKQLLEHKSPLYGRFTDIINLKEFTYLEAKLMLEGLSDNDFIAFFSVFGGNPYVLSKVNTKKSLKENICDLLLLEDGFLRNHLNNNVMNEFDNDPDLHSILDVIKNGVKKYSDIEEKCHISSNGLLSKRIDKLVKLDIIEAKYLINKNGVKKNKYYLIKDNLLKFYYSYIFRQDNKINSIGTNRFYEIYILPSIKEFISLRFENMVRQYFSILCSIGKRNDVIEIGSYFSPNNEFDCVLKKNDKTYAVYEAKYYTKPISLSEIKKELEQIKEIKGLNISEIGFVCSSGYKSKLENIQCLDLNDILFKK